MTKTRTKLCVLITNAFIENWSGSELYVRDVAVELIKQGHKPIVYSPRIGRLAEEFGRKSIPVVKDLDSIRIKPDLIHGQHHLETMTAIAHFPETPAVYFCHGWMPWEEIPPLHPRIIRYVTVSDALRDRLVYEYGIPIQKVTTILNSVDLERFHPRSPLPSIPKRALIFNSQINNINILSPIREACMRFGILIDIIGYGNNNPSHDPETQLGNYDIVFAVGRSALESLAIGSAVICCGLEGVGQMVTTQNLGWLRRNNFGIRVLNKPITADIISAEIQRYDPQDALEVSEEIRATAGLRDMVDQIFAIYKITLAGLTENIKQNPIAENLAFSDYLKGISDRHYQALAESRLAHEEVRILQNELNFIKNRLTWKAYQMVNRISFIRNLYITLTAPIRHLYARRKKK